MPDRIRRALLQGIEALEDHSAASAGWADIELRRQATEELRRSLLHLRGLERAVEAYAEDSQVLEWLLSRFPHSGEEVLGIDPSPWVGRPPALMWRQAILHAMKEDGE